MDELVVLENKGLKITVPFKVDTGAETNVINVKIIESLKAEMAQSTTTLRGYNKAVINNVRQVRLAVCHRDQTKMVRFEVVDDDSPPIPGLQTCEDFGIVKHISEVTSSILESYPDVF